MSTPRLLEYLDTNRGVPDSAPLGLDVTFGHLRELFRAYEAQQIQRDDAKVVVVAMWKAIEDARAALGDNAQSQTLGGKGICDDYYHSVDAKLRAALGKVERLWRKWGSA